MPNSDPSCPDFVFFYHKNLQQGTQVVSRVRKHLNQLFYF